MVSIFTGLGAGFERGSAATLGAGGLLGGAALGRGGETAFLNAATGNLVLQRQDEFLAGRGPDIGVTRTYNSLGATAHDDNGDQWRQSSDRRVIATGAFNVGGHQVTRISADGSAILYTYGAWSDGSYYRATDGSGAYDKLHYASNVWTWTDGATQIKETYEDAVAADTWRIASQSDPDLNSVTFTYVSGSDKIKSIVTSTNGVSESIEYQWGVSDADDRISAIVTKYDHDLDTGTAQLVRTLTTYAYDAYDRLTSVTVDMTPDNTGDSSTYTTTYTYVGATNRVATIGQTDGSLLEIRYDASNRVEWLLLKVDGTTDVRTTKIEYQSGYTNIIVYQGQYDPSSPPTPTPRTVTTSLYHDANGQLTKVVMPATETSSASEILYSYDGLGNLTKVTDALGAETDYTYDARGNVATIEDALGNVTTRTYNSENALTLEAYTASTGSSSATTLYTRYIYTSENHLRYVISSEGRVTEYRYTAPGEIEEIVTYPEHKYTATSAPTMPSDTDMDTWRNGLSGRESASITRFTYDARGNVTAKLQYSVATSSATSATTDGYSQQYLSYDRSGRLLSSRLAPDAYAQTFVYDGLGRVIFSTDLAGGTTSIVFNDASTTTVVTTRASYNAGTSSWQASSDSLVTTSIYNKAGELISQAEAGTFTTGAAAYHYYDKNGLLRRTVDATGRKTFYIYNDRGQRVADIAQDGQVVAYKYDAMGRLIETARYNVALSSLVDLDLTNAKDVSFGRGLTRPSQDSTLVGGADMWSWTTYNALGQVTATIQGDGSVTKYEYDAAGRLIKTLGYYNKISVSAYMTTPPSTAPSVTADTNGRDVVIRNFYDGDGRLIGVLNAEGGLSRIIYDHAGRKIAETAYATLTNGADRASGTFATLLNGVDDYPATDVTTRFVYDGQGLLRFAVDPLGRVTEYIYRSGSDHYANGVVRKVIVFDDTPSLSSFTYAALDAAVTSLRSDADNRVSFNVYNERGQLAYSINALGAVTGFTYDAGGRVIRTNAYAVAYNTASIGNDSAWLGNLNSWAAITGNQAGMRVTHSYYNERNELRYTIDALNFINGFTYDAEGRLLTQTRYTNTLSPSGATLSSIDAYAKGTAFTTSFAYDNLGRISEVTDATSTTRTNYFNNGAKSHEIRAYGHGDEAQTYFEYDQAGKLIKRVDAYGQAEAATTLYAYDGIGNLATVTDPRGNVTTYAYDKAGRVIKITDPSSAETDYVYDALGRTVKTIDARDKESFSYFDKLGRIVLAVDAAGYAVETQYNGFGEVWKIIARANVTSGASTTTPPTITANASEDATTIFTYDKLGRAQTATDALAGVKTFTLNAFGQLVKTTDPLTYASYVYYDALGRVRLSVDAEGYVTETTYNAQGLVYTVTRRALKASNAYSESVEPIVTADPLDATTTYAYDGAGRVTSETNALGVVTSYTYDKRGNITQKVENAGSAVAAEKRTTLYTYDDADRVKTITHDALAAAQSSTGSTLTRVESFVYDLAGNLIEKGDTSGARTLYWHDARGQVKYELTATEIDGANKKGALTRYYYDANGNVTETRRFGALVTLPASPGGTEPTEPGAYRATTYTYDNMNRVKTSVVVGVRNAVYVGGALSVDASNVNLTTTYDYDANGNVILVTAPDLTKTYSFYDKLGRKTDQIDAGLYRTKWSYDANGNVLSEHRYANAQSSAPSTPGGAPPLAPTADTANDRVTSFTYDKLGQRLSETRAAVLVHNGTGGQTSSSSVVTYTYNGLGAVTSKTEAIGEKIIYEYDRIGRLVREKRTLSGQTHLYADAFGVNVTPTVDYAYNALNDLATVTVAGSTKVISGTPTTTAQSRVTSYAYAAGGVLVSKTDAEGFVRSYVYDAASRVVREQYTRVKPSGSADEAIGYDYDLAGRIIAQGAMVKVSGVYTRSITVSGLETIDTSVSRYNAYGEVSERGINGVYAEKFEYDAAGRLLRTNAGDGVWKYFMYDAAGNQTLMIASEGTAIGEGALVTLDAVLDLWGANRANIATNYVDGVVATITKYDARNHAIEVREPQRELSTTTKADLVTQRAFNAFGETAYEINAAGARVDYTYNTMGRVIKIQSPLVAGVGENGQWITGYDPSTYAPLATSATATTFRPEEHRYYDLSGRLVASRDGNGKLTRLTLLAGTGHSGAQALVRVTTTADGATVTTEYDIHGDARIITDQISRVTTQTFDRAGRVLQIARPEGLTESFAYDGLGQRIKRWNNQLGVGNAEAFVFDQQGRVIQTTDAGGYVTSIVHGWNSAAVTQGMGAFGGWTRTTTYANSKTVTETSDMFGRDVQKFDMSLRQTDFIYDKAGRVTKRDATHPSGVTGIYQDIETLYYNTGRMRSLFWFNGNAQQSTRRAQDYTYDVSGNVTTEKHYDHVLEDYWTEAWVDYSDPWEPIWHDPEHIVTDVTIDWMNASASYDLMGRMTSWTEAGTPYKPYATISYLYDANSNIRNSNATFKTVDQNGVASSGTTNQNYWYRYDALNRVVLQKGTLSGGAIVRGTGGVDLSYDYAGQRVQVINSAGTETYTYDLGGRLEQTNVGGVRRGVFSYDLMGRVTGQIDYEANGTTVAYSRSVTYNASNQVTTDTTNTKRGSTVYGAVTTYTYGVGTAYALGSPLTVSTANYQNSSYQNTSTTTNTYEYWDGAVLKLSSYKPISTGSTTNTASHTYTNYGGQAARLESVSIADGRPRTVAFRNDLHGQVNWRRESDQLSNQGDPHEHWHRFAGKLMGYTGNNGTNDKDYAASIADRTATQGSGAFRNGATTHTVHSDFDQSLAPINSFYAGGASVYTVRQGDTLESIAASVWGDSSLWYHLAEANGLAGSTALTDGQTLVIPAGVMKSTHNAKTFTPYDPADIRGNTSPTTPHPAKKGKCGGVGQIILVAIAVVVAIWTAGAAAGAMGAAANGTSILAGAMNGGAAAFTGGLGTAVIAGGGAGTTLTATGTFIAGAIGGAGGSIVTQGIGVATGIQEKFSWNAVALAALSGGFGAGGAQSQNWVQAAAKAVSTNVSTQLIGTALGLQKEFSWAGVAAAGVAAGVGHAVGRSLPGAAVGGNRATWYNNAASGTASAIASGAVRSLIEGSNFGDNVMAALPDVIGQTIGEAIAGSMTGRGASRTGAPNTNKTPQTAEQVKAVATYGLAKASKTVAPIPDDYPIKEEPEIVVTAPIKRGSEFYTYQAPRSAIWTYLETARPDRLPTYEELANASSGGYCPPTQRPNYEQEMRRQQMAQEAIDLQLGPMDPTGPSQIEAAGQGLLEMTGLPSIRRSARAFASGDPGLGVVEGAFGLAGVFGMKGMVTGRGGVPVRQELVDITTPNAGPALAIAEANALGGINPRLTQRLEAWRAYQARGGSLDLRGWVKQTQGVSWGTGARSGYADWITSLESTHGNSALSNRPAYLYQLYSDEGGFLKWGISQNPGSRYSSGFMADKQIFEYASGSRADMLRLERSLVETQPGPLNFEPWAGARGRQ